MFRGWKGIALAGVAGAALFAGAVFYAVHRPPRPEGYSGLTFAPLTPAAAHRTPMLGRGGAQIFAVTGDSPADKAGIKPGDVLLDVNGQEITDTTRLLNVIAQIKPGTDAKIRLMRKNKEMLVDVMIGKRPPPPKGSSDDSQQDE